MKILVLSPQLPCLPDSGSKIRTYNIIKHLARRHQVRVVCFASGNDYSSISILESLGIMVETVEQPSWPNRFRYFVDKLRNAFSVTPWVVKMLASAAMKARIEQIQGCEQFDLMLFEVVFMTQYLLDSYKMAKVLDEHNIESRIHQRLLPTRPFYLKPYYWLEYIKLKSYEKKMARRFDCVLAVSDEDANILQSWLPGSLIEVVPNGVDIEYFKPNAVDSSQNSVVFTGIMNWPPNIDAVQWFTSMILPLIRERLPDVVFHIVGQKPVGEVLELTERDPSVVVTGWVEDIRPFIAKAKVYIAPIRAGSGTRLKILEAMALGKPVVSTSLGCEGLKVHPGRDIYIADEPGEFARRVVELLLDGETSREMASKAREMVTETYDWKRCLSKLDGACR